MPSSSPEDMMAAMSASLRERTGRDLGEWVRVVAEDGPDPLDQNAVRTWLRDVHGVRQNSRWTIADAAARSAGWVRPTVTDYIDSQYSGRRAGFRSVYDAVAALALGLGDDVRVEGRSTYVPFVRGRQFAAVAATTARVDLGLRFVDPPQQPRLVAGRAPGQSTHRVVLTSVADVDDDVAALLRAAYDQNP